MDDQRVRDAIALEATEWFVMHRSGRPSSDEHGRFVAWLRSSPLHVEEYLRVAVLSRTLKEDLAALNWDIDALVLEAREDEGPRVLSFADRVFRVEEQRRRNQYNGARWRRPVALSLGAALALVAIGAVLWQSTGVRFSAVTVDRLVTGPGEHRFWQLPDGSGVRLDSDSMVLVRFSRRERLASVTRGQALFDVAHDPGRRFRALAGRINAIAVGTEFDVQRSEHSTLVTVVQGKVAVFSHESAPPPSGDTLPPADAAVAAGEQVSINDNATFTKPVIQKADVIRAIAWSHNDIEFDRQRLGELAEAFNRSGAIPIVIESDRLRNLTISGIFNTYDAESLLAFISRLDGVQIRKESTRIVVGERQE